MCDKKTLKTCHIYGMLQRNAKGRHISFHTPGHKDGRWDITELSFSDNLSSPRGCIAEAERDIAEILGANRSFILTDGSTSGVLSMLHAAKATGVRSVIVIEPVHKSVYNACSLLKLTPFFFTQTLSVLEEQPYFGQADAVLCTSPDYYGKVLDLPLLRALCDKTGKLLLIDGAHGGHLHFNKQLYAGAYGDIWVDGVHKSLPALTQGAVVSARTERLAKYLREAVDVFRTTSPSYPSMASVEYAVKYPENNGLETAVRAYAKAQERVQVNGDWTKLCAFFGEYAKKAQQTLEALGIYAEFCDGETLCFYLSPATKHRDFRLLTKTLDTLFKRFPATEKKKVQRTPAPVLLHDRQTEWIPLDKSVGRVAAANCGLFPPCTPLVKVGEVITREHLTLLQNADNVFGIYEDKIAVWIR